jgi:hypothetical protein
MLRMNEWLATTGGNYSSPPILGFRMPEHDQREVRDDGA